jgi:F-type H+-transporting ATPase subunit a
MLVQEIAQEHAAAAVEGHAGKFDAGETIIHHVANSPINEPLVHLPKVMGIDLSVTKHVMMLWVVAVLLLVVLTWAIRRYLKQDRLIPSGFMNGLEAVVEFIRDEIVKPNVGQKWVMTWAPLVLTFAFFIFTANIIGLVPIFDVLGLLDHFVLHTADGSFVKQVMHGGTTATANYNVTAALSTITFGAIIVAGSKAHGVVKHWMNLVPPGFAWPIYILLIPIEIMGMFVRPFALTMRLAANMTGGHIALLSLLSLVFLFAEIGGQSVGLGAGLVMSLPLAIGISLLEVIVVLVQAYVFTLLTAVFVGMAIHVHH